MNRKIEGVFCAAATPVSASGEPDLALFSQHCGLLLEEGCHGIAMLGTTGEANSFSIAQRKALLEAAISHGIEASQLLPGTSTPSVDDTIELTTHAVQKGVAGCVLLPPFYYKGVTDEGLYRFYARVIDGVADDRLRVVLYHIPQVSQVPISHDLIERLMTDYPGIVTNIKDSAGDIDNMKTLCQRFPDLGVLAGADPLMLPLLQAGGAGCITATSNLIARSLRTVWDAWDDPLRREAVDAAQDNINTWRNLSNRHVQLPTIKTMISVTRGSSEWLNMMPPLVGLCDEERKDIQAEVGRLLALPAP